MYDTGLLLPADCGAASIFLKKLAITHKDAVQEVFAGRPSGAEEVVGYHYRSLLYSDLGEQK